MDTSIDAEHACARAIARAFRSSVHATRCGRIEAWSFAWQELANISNAAGADILLEHMAVFVDDVEATAARPVMVLPPGCPGLCRDE